MRHLNSVRTQVLTHTQQIEAVFSSPALFRLAAEVEMRQPVGRPQHHPAWALLAYGVLARVFRSGAKVEVELAQPQTWQQILVVVDRMRALHPDLDIPAAGRQAPDWPAWKHARNKYFTDPAVLAQLQQRFTELAVEQARSLGLLDPAGPGSLCHPDRSGVVYGDGTVIRPMYRPPTATRSTDPATGDTKIAYRDAAGNAIPKPTRRYDPDAADYHGHTGSVHGQNYVALYARGDLPHQRVVLAVARVDRPGREADTAVTAIKALHTVAAGGIQAVVYDGAMRGKHIDDLMSTCGVVVINKVHASAKTAARNGKTKPARWFTLGLWEHEGENGQACTHQLAAVDGAIHEVALDEQGRPAIVHRLARKQVKRPRRASGRFHFNVAYEVPCATGAFLAWVTPHGEAGDPDHRRADAVRVIAEGDADFARLYGVRNDAEAFNSALKRTLLVNRAMSLGGARQLLDVLAYGLLNNAIAAHHAATAKPTRQSGRIPDELPLAA